MGALGALADMRVFVFGSITITLCAFEVLSVPGNVDGNSGYMTK